MTYYTSDYVTHILRELTRCDLYFNTLIYNDNITISFEKYYRYFYNITVCHNPLNTHIVLRDVYNNILKKTYCKLFETRIVLNYNRVLAIEDILIYARKGNNNTNHFLEKIREYSIVSNVLENKYPYKDLPIELKDLIYKEFSY